MSDQEKVERIKEEALLTDFEFLVWCGSHMIKNCGKTRIMEGGRLVSVCEDCRSKAQIDKLLSHKDIRVESDNQELPEPIDNPYLGILYLLDREHLKDRPRTFKPSSPLIGTSEVKQ